MSDIFISYSSHDKAQADQLSELLCSAGLSVWIDNQGIVGAENWATEIVEGIRACSTFIILLSPQSIQSENVLRELSLASEKRKRVLPVDLEPTILPPSFEYPLAGLQRVAITDFDKIIHAHRHGIEKVVLKDIRKSLIILPFEDISPLQDNLWFANGLVGELIDMLGKIKSLRILDRKSSLDLRRVNLTTVQLGREFNTRYFVEGAVRKFNEQIRISVSLLDIETGENLWQESYKGEMKDVFDLQESVAEKVVEALKLHLTKEEKSLLQERGTENPEVYELYMRAIDYFSRQTKESFTIAIELYSEALRLDPFFAKPYSGKATALTLLYDSYGRDPALLEEAEQVCKDALERNLDYLGISYSLMLILMYRGKLEEAERAAQELVKKAPEISASHFALAFFYSQTGQTLKSIAPYEAALRLEPESLACLTNVVGNCDASGERDKCAYWAGMALPILEKHLRLHPDDQQFRVWRAVLMHFTGRDADALEVARELTDTNSLRQIRDGGALHNTACLFGQLGEKAEALHVLLRAIDAGYHDSLHLKAFLDDDVGSLAGTPEYEKVKRKVEEIEREAKGKMNV